MRVPAAVTALGSVVVTVAIGCTDLPVGSTGPTKVHLSWVEQPTHLFVDDTVEVAVEVRLSDGSLLLDPPIRWMRDLRFDQWQPLQPVWADSGRARIGATWPGEMMLRAELSPHQFHFVGDPVSAAVQRVYAVTDVSIEDVGSDTTVYAVGSAAFSVTVLDRHGAAAIDRPLAAYAFGDGIVSAHTHRDRVDLFWSGSGTDTVVVSHAHCVGSCADTLVITLERVPGSIQVWSFPLSSIGDTVSFQTEVYDTAGLVIAGQLATWSYMDPSDSAIVTLLDPEGRMVARDNGIVTFALTAGDVTDSASVTVRQVADSAVFVEPVHQIVGIGTTDTVSVLAWDANGYSIPPDLVHADTVHTSGRTKDAVGWGPDEIVEIVSFEHELVVRALEYGYAEVLYNMSRWESAYGHLNVTADADSIRVWPANDTIAVGDSTFMHVDVFQGDTVVAGATASWTALDPGVEVYVWGPVWGVSEGTVRIEGRAGSAVDTAVVVVNSGG